MNKKLIAIVLAALMVVMVAVFAGCGGNSEGETTDSQTSACETNATSDLEYIKNKGKLVVGMTYYEPMNYKDENGELVGFDTEFAEAVAEKLGVEVEFFEIADWDNKFVELSTKNIDCVWNGMTITDEARKNSSVSNAYAKNAQVVVMKADKVDEYKDVESMKDLTFVAEQGSAGKSTADENGFNCTEVKFQTDALLEVKSGAADACIIDLTMAEAMTGEGSSYADLACALELAKEEYGISCREGSDLTAEINKIMDEMKNDGSLAKIAEKYEVVLAD